MLILIPDWLLITGQPGAVNAPNIVLRPRAGVAGVCT